MTGYPGFDILLKRLADRRNIGLGELSRQAGIAEAEVQSVLGGAVPSASLLRRLAPALDLHAADLFAIALQALPDDLAPVDARAGLGVPQVVGLAMRLSPEHLRLLRQDVESLPHYGRAQPPMEPQPYEQYAPGIGAVLMHMLSNRNLRWTGSAKVLSRLTGVHLSPSTIGMIGRGDKELTIDLLAAFAIVLGIQFEDLAALAGVEPPESTPVRDPMTVDIAKLIWDVRRLTPDQVQEVREKAESMMSQD